MHKSAIKISIASLITSNLVIFLLVKCVVPCFAMAMLLEHPCFCVFVRQLIDYKNENIGNDRL